MQQKSPQRRFWGLNDALWRLNGAVSAWEIIHFGTSKSKCYDLR
jgi:hypothetical protein